MEYGKGKGKKTCFITFRVTEREKANIREAALALGLSMSGYVTRLHRLFTGNKRESISEQ